MEQAQSIPMSGIPRLWSRYLEWRRVRRLRAIVHALGDCSLEREIANAHEEPRRSVIRREALRREIKLVREAQALGGVRQAVATLHPASTAARIVGAEREG